MKSKIKKIIAVLLIFAMMFCVLPLNVFARDTAPVNSETITLVTAPETAQQEIAVGSTNTPTLPTHLLATLTKVVWKQVSAQTIEGENPQSKWESITTTEEISVAIEWVLQENEIFSTAEEKVFTYTAKLAEDTYNISSDVTMPTFSVNVIKAQDEQDRTPPVSSAPVPTSAPANAPAPVSEQGSVVVNNITMTPDTYYTAKKGDGTGHTDVYLTTEGASISNYVLHLSADSSTLTINNLNAYGIFSTITSTQENLTIYGMGNNRSNISGVNLKFTGGVFANIITATKDINIDGNIVATTISAINGNITMANGDISVNALASDEYAIKTNWLTVNSGANLVATTDGSINKNTCIDATLIVNDGGVVNAMGGANSAGGNAIDRAIINGGNVTAVGGDNSYGIARDLTMSGGTVNIDSNGDGIGNYATVSGGSLTITASRYGIADGDVGQDTTITGGHTIIKGGIKAFEIKPVVTTPVDKQVRLYAGEFEPGILKDSTIYDYSQKYINLGFITVGDIVLAGTTLNDGYYKFNEDGTYTVGTDSDYNVRLVTELGVENLYLNNLSISGSFANEVLKITGDLTILLIGANSINNTRETSTAITAQSNLVFAGGGSLIVQGTNGVGINATADVIITDENTSLTSIGDAQNGITANYINIYNKAIFSSLGTLNAQNITVNNATLSATSLNSYGIIGNVYLQSEGSVTSSGVSGAFSKKPSMQNFNSITTSVGENQSVATNITDLEGDYHQNKYVRIEFKNIVKDGVMVLGTKLTNDTYYLVENTLEGKGVLKTEGANASNYQLHLSADGTTLTMNNLDIYLKAETSLEFFIGIYSDLTIYLVGKNTVHTTNHSIISTKNLTIKADSKDLGKLSLFSEYISPINVDGALSIQSSYFSAIASKNIVGAAHGIVTDYLFIENDSNVVAVGGEEANVFTEGAGIVCDSIFVKNSQLEAQVGSVDAMPTTKYLGINASGNIYFDLGSTIVIAGGINRIPIFPIGATVTSDNSDYRTATKISVSSEVSTARTMFLDFSHLQYRSLQGSSGDYATQGDVLYLGTYNNNPVSWIRLNDAGLMLSKSQAGFTYDNLSATEKTVVNGGAFGNLSAGQVTSLVGDSSQDNLNDDATVRPTFTVNANNILFYTQIDESDVEGSSTPVGSFYQTTDKIGGTLFTAQWKLRIVDSSRTFSVSNIEVNGDTITYDYANALTGSGEYISVLILDDSGKNIIYYGKVLDLSANSENATGKTFTLPQEIAKQSNMRLQFFNENESGTQAPNITSAFARETEVEENKNPLSSKNITINSTLNGTVITNPATSAFAGTNITITATANSGYEVDTVTVKDADGGNIEVSGTGSSRTFSMPNKNVTVTVTFSALPAVATPVFAPNDRSFDDTVNVTIATTTADATIYYTTNGDIPTASSTAYNNTPIELNATTTIKAIAIKEGMSDSAVASATFTKNSAPSYTVTFDDEDATTPVNPTSKTVTSPAITVGNLPIAPTKTGYTFGGWYTEVHGGGTQFTATTTVTASITVYAKWTENAAPTVTGVTVSPSVVTVQKGTTKQFSAIVQGENNPAQTVKWTVEGNNDNGTSISEDGGLLTIAVDETATTLTIRATSTVDNSKSATATVTVNWKQNNSGNNSENNDSEDENSVNNPSTLLPVGQVILFNKENSGEDIENTNLDENIEDTQDEVKGSDATDVENLLNGNEENSVDENTENDNNYIYLLLLTLMFVVAGAFILIKKNK